MGVIRFILHPLPIRIIHWLFALSVTMLIITGIFISNPITIAFFLQMDMHKAKAIHFIFSRVSIILLMVRVYYSIITGDYRNFLFKRSDVVQAKGLAKYYLFILKEEPKLKSKYNVGQRLVYDFWLMLMLVQIVTGFILFYGDTSTIYMRIFGGIQTIRFIHFLVMVFFLGTVPLHIYLSLVEDPARLQSMFTGMVRKILPEEENQDNEGASNES